MTTSITSTGRVRSSVHALSRALAVVAIVCIVVVALATVADVVRRAAFGESIAGVTELGEIMMVAIVFSSLAFAEGRGAHVSMTLVRRRLPPRAAAILNGLGLLLTIAIVAWMFVVTADRAYESFLQQEYRFGLVRLPIWPARVAIAVGLAAYLAELCLRFVDDVREAFS